MGAIQEPTPDMGPYRTEIRGESFYITREGTPDMCADRHGAVLPYDDFTALTATLDQVLTHPQWARWDAADRPGPADLTWTLAPGAVGPLPPAAWEIEVVHDRLHIRGPWVVMFERGRLWGVEMAYGDASAFLFKLCQAVMTTH